MILQSFSVFFDLLFCRFKEIIEFSGVEINSENQTSQLSIWKFFPVHGIKKTHKKSSISAIKVKFF